MTDCVKYLVVGLALAGDGMGPILVSLDSPHVLENGRPQIDRLGTSNLAPLVVGGQINPQLAANNVRVIKDTHGRTSHLSAADVDALEAYLVSLSLSRPLTSSSGSGSSTADAGSVTGGRDLFAGSPYADFLVREADGGAHFWLARLESFGDFLRADPALLASASHATGD